MTEDYYDYSADIPADAISAFIVIYIVIILLSLASTIACCIITYKLAEKKGKNGGLWLVLSLFLGWIATIIVACMSAEPNYNNQNYYNGYYNSPYNPYGNPYANNQYNTPYSNPYANPYEQTATPQQTAPVEEQAEKEQSDWQCPSCGSSNSAGNRFCAYCGNKKPE